MDALTVIGIIFAFGSVLGGQYLEGGDFNTILNAPAFFIVFGGTFAAVILQTSSKTFFRALKMFIWILFPPKINYETKIKALVDYTNVVRNSGAIGLEGVLPYEKDPILLAGLQDVADATEYEVIKHSLTVKAESQYIRDISASKVFESMGGYSPTIGIIGAVLGLIKVMSDLSAPEDLGHGIAVAFVATLYGISFANLLYIPISKKLKYHIDKRHRYNEMLIEGVISIAQGMHPKVLESRLRSFMSDS